MNTKAARGQRDGLPMPLGLQGAFESAQGVVISALVVVIPLLGVWLTGGFNEPDFSVIARLAGQIWLALHGVPLHLSMTLGPSSASLETGTLNLLPLGLILIPFFLSWRAGRRLARASYTDQLWQPLLGAIVVYAAAGLATAFVCSTGSVQAQLLPSMLIPLIPAGLGLITGARREAGSWGRLIGVNAADWISTTSQDQRWAGSYAWAVARSGAVALLAALALSCALFTINLIGHWTEIVSVYQGLKPGAAGGAALTLLQLGYLPNLGIWSLAWSSGAGFSLGVGSTLTPLATAVAPVPAIPLLAALPTGELSWGVAAMIIPVLGGVLAGWWFVRAGENHLDEWLSLKVRQRWLSLPASTVVLSIAIGAVAAALAMGLFWLSQGSAGLGRLTVIGPDPVMAALWVGAEVAIGALIGAFLAPWIEQDATGPAPLRRRE